ncbi:hypothetical protein M0802_001669 [Mischocyttarus mexicanus]|nr:hypothetical protein M0802_001669 [Mischocyttarus mexicanus]
MDNYCAPQWVDFTCSPQVPSDDYFEKHHEIYEPKLYTEEVEENINSDNELLEIIETPRKSVKWPNEYSTKSVSNENLEVEINNMKNTPIKIIYPLPYNNNKPRIMRQTSYDNILNEAMQNVQFCENLINDKKDNKVSLTEDVFKKPMPVKMKTLKPVKIREIEKSLTESTDKEIQDAASDTLVEEINNISISGVNVFKRGINSRRKVAKDVGETSEIKDHLKSNMSENIILKNDPSKINLNSKNLKLKSSDLKQQSSLVKKCTTAKINTTINHKYQEKSKPKQVEKDQINKKLVRSYSADSKKVEKNQINKKFVSSNSADSKQVKKDQTNKKFVSSNSVDSKQIEKKQTNKKFVRSTSVDSKQVEKDQTNNKLMRSNSLDLKQEEEKEDRTKQPFVRCNSVDSSPVLHNIIQKNAKVADTNNTVKIKQSDRSYYSYPKSRQVLNQKNNASKKMVTTVVGNIGPVIIMKKEKVLFFDIPINTKQRKYTCPVPFSFENRDKMKKQLKLNESESKCLKSNPVPNLKLLDSNKSDKVMNKLANTRKKTFRSLPSNKDINEKMNDTKQLEKSNNTNTVYMHSSFPYKRVKTVNSTKDKIEKKKIPDNQNKKDASKNDKPLAPIPCNKSIQNTKYSLNNKQKLLQLSETYVEKENDVSALNIKSGPSDKVKKLPLNRSQRKNSKKKQEEKEANEKLEIAKLRKQTQIKARPMPVYKPFILLKSTKPLTKPESPAWLIKKKVKSTL